MALVMAIIMAIILAIIHYLQGPDHGVGEDVGVVLAAEVETIHLLVVPPLQIQNYVLQLHDEFLITYIEINNLTYSHTCKFFFIHGKHKQIIFRTHVFWVQCIYTW